MRLEAPAFHPLAADDPLSAEVFHVLDRRLLTASPRPLAVALSGGGDSLALLLMAHAWAGRHGRRLLVLTVDHALRPESAAWTQACAARAARLGAGFHALHWDGPKPAAGLPAAARAARHALLADAARAAGARVILLGHTGDDLGEAQAMRASGSSTPDPREWSPSPAWPEGRGVLLLRPLLGLRRAALRHWLAARGESWIDDPANTDLRYARARARASGGASARVVADTPLAITNEVAAAPGGGLRLARSVLADAGEAEAVRLVALACVCAGGGARPPRRDRAQVLTARLHREARLTATLAGARVEAADGHILFVREAGEAGRGGLAPIELQPGQPAVWDGRFEIAVQARATVVPLAGRRRSLGPAAEILAAALPAPVRAGLPLVLPADGSPTCPVLCAAAGIELSDLVRPRLIAAAGLIAREPD